MGLVIPPSTLVVTVDGVDSLCTNIVAPTGATMQGTAVILPAPGQTGGGGGSGGVVYTVFITEPSANEQKDVGVVTVAVRIVPAPPNDAVVVMNLDGVDIGWVDVVAGIGTIDTPALQLGQHRLQARIIAGSGTFLSAETLFLVANQQPVVTIVAPADESDAPIGTLAVTATVEHPTADPEDFTVQASLDEHFGTAVPMVYDPETELWGCDLEITQETNNYVHVRAYDATPGGAPVNATPHLVCSLPIWIPFHTEGDVLFEPLVELVPGATILWEFSDNTTSTSTTPSKTWGTEAHREHRVSTNPPNAITAISFGYGRWEDAGKEVLDARYERPQCGVSWIGNPGRLSKTLEIFCAAHNPLGGEIDFRNFTRLKWIECFQSSLSDIKLDGCAVERLCFEANALTELDLTGVQNMRDLRAAVQQGGTLHITQGYLPELWHYCAQTENLTVTITEPGVDLWATMPKLEESWAYANLTLTGTYAPVSNYLTWVRIDRCGYSRMLLPNKFPPGRNGRVEAWQTELSEIDLTGCPGITYLDLHDAQLSAMWVDYVLTTMNSFGTSNGWMDLRQNSGPTSTGAAAAAALRLRGWTVYTEAAADAGVNSDTFDRADGPVGNGWLSVQNSAVAEIASNQLHITSNGDYRIYCNPGVNLPANYYVEAEYDDSQLDNDYNGIVGRWAAGNGVRLIIINRGSLHLGEAAGLTQGNVSITVTNGFPSSWTNGPGPHTLRLEMVGTTCTIYCDGQEYGYGTVAVNATTVGTAYGFCGGAAIINSVTTGAAS